MDKKLWMLVTILVAVSFPLLTSCGDDDEAYSGGKGTKHEYVDLGLPSGTLWATCNIGASSPEDYGDYFAWGEISGHKDGKTDFHWDTYKWCNGTYNTMTKYCTDSDYGTVDDKMELDLEDDAAFVNWGIEWRIPSKAQLDELIDTRYTRTEWITQSDVPGIKVTSRKNENSIFLPAAGDYAGNSLHLYAYNQDSPCRYGCYISRSLGMEIRVDGVNNSDFYALDFWLVKLSENRNRIDYYQGCSRYTGCSVRPVRSSQ